MTNDLVTNVSKIQQNIHILRGYQVVLDRDLAELYQTEIKALNRATRRNLDRFPEDFMFELNESEYLSLQLKNSDLKPAHGKHRKYLPLAYTEQGISMLSTVLNTPLAIQVNIAIMRTFVQLRKGLEENHQSSEKLNHLTAHTRLQFKLISGSLLEVLTSLSPHKAEVFRTHYNLILKDDPDSILTQLVAPSLNPKAKPDPSWNHDLNSLLIDQVQDTVAHSYKLNSADLRKAGRTKTIALARQVAMYLVRAQANITYRDLGFHFGKRNHTTAMHACLSIEKRIETDPSLKSAIEYLQQVLK